MMKTLQASFIGGFTKIDPLPYYW